jgi:hypothetical protein
MRSIRRTGWIALAAVLAAQALAAPSSLHSQYTASWRAQFEARAGWLLPHGEVTQLLDGAGDVQLRSTAAWGGRVLLPVAGVSTGMLGRVSIGLQGIVAPSAEMTNATSSTPIGTSDYYQVTGLITAGHFMPSRPVNMTLTGALGAGVGHRTFTPNTGFTLVEAGNASTALVLVANLGFDMLVHSRISVLAEAGITLGIRDRNGQTVVERSSPVLLGLGVRF